MMNLLLLLLLAPSFIEAFAPRPQYRCSLGKISQRTHSNVHVHRHRHNRFILLPTQLNMSSSQSSSLPEPSRMRVKELRAELESYGISTKSFLEKGEMVEAVVKARKDGATATKGGGDADTASASAGFKGESKTKSEGASKTKSEGASKAKSKGESKTKSSSSSSSTESRATRLAKEIEKCKSIKVSELKSELASYGISTKSFFEKSEFVRACAEARVDGADAGSGAANGSKSRQEEFDPSYRDVVIRKMSKEDAMQLSGKGWMDPTRSSVIDVRLA